MKGTCITDGVYEDVNKDFERALVFLHAVSGHPLIMEAIRAVSSSNVMRRDALGIIYTPQ